MSNEASSYSRGYLCIPRSLLEHSTVRALNNDQFRILMYILENACFEKCQQDDHGVTIDLEPGQLLCTVRQLASECNTSKNMVERFIARAKCVQIMRQSPGHKKTILTITHKETYDLCFSPDRTNFRTILGQSQDNLRTQKKERKESKKSKNSSNTAAAEKVDLFSIHFDREKKEFKGIQESHMKLWQEAYAHLDLIQELNKMKVWLLNPQNPKRKGDQKFIEKWFSNARTYDNNKPNTRENNSSQKSSESGEGEPRFRSKRHFSFSRDEGVLHG